MATGDSTLDHSVYLKENVWYAYNSRYVFNHTSDPSLSKLNPSIGDAFYIILSTTSSTSTTYTFSTNCNYWGTVTEVINNDKIICKRASDNEEYAFVRMKYDGSLRAWYSSSDNQRVYTVDTTPRELEGFYNADGVVYEGYDISVGNFTAVKISSVVDNVSITLSGSEKF